MFQSEARVLSAGSRYPSNFTSRKVFLGAFNTEINLHKFSCETLKTFSSKNRVKV